MRGRARAFLVVLVLVACTPAASPSPEAGVPRLGAGWHALPDGPLSERQTAHALWTGSQVLVVGGSDAPPCPPNADCALPDVPPLRDGAAYDPATQTWRAIAAAPLPLGFGSGAIVDGTVWLWIAGFEPGDGVRAALLAYDVAADSWREVELPDPPPIGSELVAAGSRVLFVQTSHENAVAPDRLYEPSTATWEDLPADPIGPAYDRSMIWTGRSLVLVAIPLARPPVGPSLYRAAVWDPGSGVWQRLPDPDITGYDPTWWWVDGRVVNASPGSSDGGQVNPWGRSIPHGGILDPAAGWRPLPDPPRERSGSLEVAAAGSEHVVAGGWVLHVPSGRWVELGDPPGGPIAGAAGTWAGDRLLVWGGVRWAGMRGDPLDEGWVWLPA